MKTAKMIQGRRYVQIEGWQAIANAFGCVASARNVERVEGGFRATGQVIRLSDGTVISEAEGFVGDDEATWARRPVFARRAMAQTRAMSRACRSAFAFVVTLMDAGLETTPAEEMTHVVDTEPLVVRPKFDEPARAISEAHVAKPARVGWRDRVAQAATVDELGGIGDDADAALSAGKLTAAQRETLDALIAERHDEIEAMAGA